MIAHDTYEWSMVVNNEVREIFTFEIISQLNTILQSWIRPATEFLAI